MKKKYVWLWLLLLMTPVWAQPQKTSEMRNLDFLVGDWKGEGWIEMGPGGRSNFRQTEKIESKLDGTVLLVEGIGRGKLVGKGEETVIHHAFAVISYDSRAKKILFRAFRKDGSLIDADATASENTLVWGFRDPQRGTEIKYTIKLTSAGEWLEIGEFSMDGKSWRKFFEMTLQRAK